VPVAKRLRLSADQVWGRSKDGLPNVTFDPPSQRLFNADPVLQLLRQIMTVHDHVSKLAAMAEHCQEEVAQTGNAPIGMYNQMLSLQHMGQILQASLAELAHHQTCLEDYRGTQRDPVPIRATKVVRTLLPEGV
jgi:hypothetical protein